MDKIKGVLFFLSIIFSIYYLIKTFRDSRKKNKLWIKLKL